MTLAIEVRGLGKRYRVLRELSRGVSRPPARSLVEEISRAAGVAARRLRGLPGHAVAEEFWALRDAGFAVAPGEVIGVIGRNGSGKSTLLKMLSRVTEPTEGAARLRGRVASLLEVGTGFHPDLSVRQNIFLNGAILGMRRREIAARLDQIVEYAGVESFLGEPVKHLSSGLYMRLAFAVAAFLDAEILLVDEVLAVGDAAFQEKSLRTMRDAVSGGRTVLFVSHNMAAIGQLTERCIVLDGGRITFDGPTAEALRFYLRDRRQLPLGVREDTDRIKCVRRWRRDGGPIIREMGLAPGEPPEVSPGGRVRLEFLVESAQARQRLRLLYSLNGPSGEPLLTGISPAFACGPGRRVVELTIADLNVIPGDYDLTIGLGEGSWDETKLEYDAYIGFGHLRVSNLRPDGRSFGSWLPTWSRTFHTSASLRLDTQRD